ncbi:MAG: pantoate--beta-alanine ligase [Gammaproteobacteria bacterium]
MDIVTTVAALRQAVQPWRQNGKTLAFVATMGNLHDGHLHLVETAKNHADHVAVSIFVNPTQFGEGEDFSDYPRTEAEDLAKLREICADLVFVPKVAELYASNAVTSITVKGLSEMHCGASRPGHFSGVATVVCKLFNIVQPDVALFGEKDYQQLVVIRRMAEDLNIPVDIVGVATVREADGLAMSSRNAYLSPEQRSIAPALYRSLCKARDLLLSGETDLRSLEKRQMRMLQFAGMQPEYFSICRSDNLMAATANDTVEWVILAAARLGRARLIDNVRVIHS